MNIADFLTQTSRTRPHGLAAISPLRAVSFESLEHTVWQIAMHMRELGVKPGQVIGFLFLREIPHLAASLAAIRIGAIQIAFSKNTTTFSLREGIQKAGVTMIFGDNNKISKAGVPAHLVTYKTFAEMRNPVDTSLRHVAPDAPYMLIAGSGTTGNSKLIPVNTTAYLDIKPRDEATRPLLPGERQFSPSPISFYTAHRRCLNGIAVGAASAFRDDEKSSFLSFCDFMGVDHLSLVPLFAEIMLGGVPADSQGVRLPDLKTALIGGSPVSEELRKNFRERISPNLTVVYGANEYGETTAAPPAMQDANPGCVGAPCPGVTLEIVDDNDKPLPPNEIGHVRIKTGTIFPGYYGDEEATAKALKNGWYYPGDTGLLTPDNVLIFKGRSDDMMIYNGMNIYPREIEIALERHPAVVAAAAFPIDAHIFHHLPVAAVVLRKPVSEMALIEYCSEQIGARGPKAISILDELPRNAGGKILKRKLAESFQLDEKLMSIIVKKN
ncbi:MAG: AMP-binding protein [Rhizobiales bacterium]|nr:AMP-binding protein [Hyphomicrobiales bacterium]